MLKQVRPEPVIVLDTINEDHTYYQPVETVFSDEDVLASSKVDISGVFSPTDGAISPSAAASSNVDNSGLPTLLNSHSGAPRFKRVKIASTEINVQYRTTTEAPSKAIHAYTDGGCNNNGQAMAFSA